MQLVRGPARIPVKIVLCFQLTCILAGAAALSFWCIVIGAAYLVDPDIGPNRIVVLSLVGLVLPFGTLASILAMPIARYGQNLPLPLRLILEALPWFGISHWAVSRLPLVYHRGPADILAGRFDWLWLSITLLAGIMGPIAAEEWVIARKRAKRISETTRAKIAAIAAEVAERNVKFIEDARKDESRAAQEIARWKGDTHSEPAFAESQVAFWEASLKIAQFRAAAHSTSDRQGLAERTREFALILKSCPGASFESSQSRTKAIRQFIRDMDWPSDLSNDRSDPLSGDVSGAAGH